MLDELAPKMERERWWEAGKAGNEVTLEGVDGPFGWVCLMVVGRDELEVDIFFREKSFEGGGAFVVAYLDLGAIPLAFRLSYGLL